MWLYDWVMFWNCIRLLVRGDLSWSVQSCKFLILFPLTGDAHDQNSEKIAKWIVDNNRYTSFCVRGQREKRIALQSGKLCKKKKVIKSGQCVCIFPYLFYLVIVHRSNRYNWQYRPIGDGVMTAKWQGPR